jgi:hypothetical protein
MTMAVMTVLCMTKAACQSQRRIIQVISGEKIKGPRPLPAMVRPRAVARFFSNQRVIRVVLARMNTLRPSDATKPYQK